MVISNTAHLVLLLFSEHLTGLIESAESNNVSFVYAISPGIDMTYSGTKEVSLLKRKLEQVCFAAFCQIWMFH